jgi:hypothetical protein
MTTGPSKPERSVKRAGPLASPPVVTGPAPASDFSSAAPGLGRGAGPNPAQVLTLQRAIGNAAVNELLRRPSSEGPEPLSAGRVHAAPPVTVARGGPARVQRVREDEFRADPPAFLRKNKVTVEMAKGLQLRYPDPDVHSMFYTNFVAMMDAYKFSRHWFVLQPNPEEETYIVTPAIEKYVEYNPEWAKHIHPKLLAAVKKGAAGPPAKDYISAAYFPYLIGAPSTKDFGGTMGHTDLAKEPSKGEGADDFNPDFAFTGFMNGCALSVTPVPQDPSKFTIWHFQSSTANKEQATTFRMENKPTDWFGENEYYPRAAEAEGVMPKVTNFLYRRDGAWHVASQISYAESATGRIMKGEPSQPVSRALNIKGGGDPVLRLKGIYVEGMQNAVNTRLRRGLEICKEHQAVIKEHQPAGIDWALQKFETLIKQILSDEEDKLLAATDVGGLHGFALGMRDNRKTNEPIVEAALGGLINAFTTMEKNELEKSFFTRSDSRRKAYSGMRIRLEDIRLLYREIGWLSELIKETTPPPSSGDDRPEGPVVPASEIPPDSASPGKERESGERSDVPGPEVGSSGVPAVAPIVIGQVPAVSPSNLALFGFLDTLDPGWNVAAVARAGGDPGMIVGQGAGVMLGVASKAEEAAPVSGEIRLPGQVRFLTNNGQGALCFVYSVVMGLTGRRQSEVQGIVAGIVATAGVQGGWIASDSAAARRVLLAAEQVFGIPIQVIELQNSVAGLIISGRSHNATRDERRPVVLRNTGAHYDAIV